ncbi:MAG: YfhO family protein [bacterium]
MNKISKFVSFLVLFFVVFLFFGKALFSHKTFVYRDIHLLMYPMKIYASSCIKNGIFPFWNPYILCGAPFAAQVHHQTLYPLSIINYILPIFFSLDLFIFLHIFLAGVFFYLLMKDQGLDSSSSLFASLSYAFSGIFLSFGNIFITITTATWSPLLLLFYLRALRRNSIFYSIVSGLVIAIEFLAGLPDFLFYDIILLSLLSFAFIFHKKSIFPLRSLFITGIVSIGISLFQLLPFLELVSLSNRKAGISFEQSSLWSLFPQEFIGFFIPLFTSIPSEEGYVFPYLGQKMVTSFYIGILPILLAIQAPFFIRRRIILFFSSILIFSLFLSMGKNLSLYPFLYKFLPFFSLMRNPIKTLHLVSISLSILAGFGFFYSKDKSKIFVPATLLFLFLAFLFYLNPKSLFFLVAKLPSPYKTNPFEVSLWYSFVFKNCLYISLILLIAILILKRKKHIAPLLICLTIFDLYLFNGNLNYLIDEGFYKKKPEIVEMLKGKFIRYIPASSNIQEMVKHIGERSRYKDFLLSKAILHGNFGMLFGLFNAGGYEGIILSDFSNLPIYKLAKMLGVKYLISKEKDGIFVYEQDCLPSAFIKTKNSKLKTKNYCKIIKYEPNKVLIKVDTEKPGFLFLSDTYYPGWRCYINKKETKIYKVNYCFRAVCVPEGKHIVEFRYIPRTFIIGLIASIISFCIIILILIDTKRFF